MVVNAYKQGTRETLSSADLQKVTGLEFTLTAEGYNTDSEEHGIRTYYGTTSVGTLASCSKDGPGPHTEVITISVPSGRSSTKHTVSLSNSIWGGNGYARITKVFF